MINFEHSTTSEPQLTPPGFTYLALKSSYLKGRGEVTVFVPPCAVGQKDLPVVVLLHGVYGSHWSWTYQIGVHQIMMDMIEAEMIPPFALVMPSDGLRGDGTGYFAHSNFDFERWIVEDVVSASTHYIAEISAASTFFITGLSMGGYGALHLGIKHARLFKALSAHSSITCIADLMPFIDEGINVDLSKQQVLNQDVFYLAKKYRDPLRNIRFDCGTDDVLIEANRLLHKRLTEAGIEHQYEEFEGEHSRDYWRAHIRDSLLWFGRFL